MYNSELKMLTEEKNVENNIEDDKELENVKIFGQGRKE